MVGCKKIIAARFLPPLQKGCPEIVRVLLKWAIDRLNSQRGGGGNSGPPSPTTSIHSSEGGTTLPPILHGSSSSTTSSSRGGEVGVDDNDLDSIPLPSGGSSTSEGIPAALRRKPSAPIVTEGLGGGLMGCGSGPTGFFPFNSVLSPTSASASKSSSAVVPPLPLQQLQGPPTECGDLAR